MALRDLLTGGADTAGEAQAGDGRTALLRRLLRSGIPQQDTASGTQPPALPSVPLGTLAQSLVTPYQSSGRSPALTVGGRRGRFNFDTPPETGGTPAPRFAFETDTGGLFFFQLQQALQGGRWEAAAHAPADFARYKALDPGMRQRTMQAMWGSNPIGQIVNQAAAEGVSFAELQRRLAPHNTHRQISFGEPAPVK